MKNQELLELAAKAAGIDGDYSPRIDAIVHPGGYWMPHNDDGDAFRLACDLKFNVEINGDWIMVTTCDLDDSIEIPVNFDDVRAAVRRAITVAAAETGRNES